MGQAESFGPDLYKDLFSRVKASRRGVANLKPASERPSERQDYDTSSSAPGLEAIVTGRVKGIYEDASADSGDYSLYSFLPGEDLEDGEQSWLLKMPMGAFDIDDKGVRFTLRASFEDGKIINSEAWASMPPGSVIEINGSNGTFWRDNNPAT